MAEAIKITVSKYRSREEIRMLRSKEPDATNAVRKEAGNTHSGKKPDAASRGAEKPYGAQTRHQSSNQSDASVNMSVVLDVSSTDTVQFIKETLAERLGVPTEKQTLKHKILHHVGDGACYGDEVLHNSWQLSEHNVRNHERLQLVHVPEVGTFCANFATLCARPQRQLHAMIVLTIDADGNAILAVWLDQAGKCTLCHGIANCTNGNRFILAFSGFQHRGISKDDGSVETIVPGHLCTPNQIQIHLSSAAIGCMSQSAGGHWVTLQRRRDFPIKLPDISEKLDVDAMPPAWPPLLAGQYMYDCFDTPVKNDVECMRCKTSLEHNPTCFTSVVLKIRENMSASMCVKEELRGDPSDLRPPKDRDFKVAMHHGTLMRVSRTKLILDVKDCERAGQVITYEKPKKIHMELCLGRPKADICIHAPFTGTNHGAAWCWVALPMLRNGTPELDLEPQGRWSKPGCMGWPILKPACQCFIQ